MSTTDRTCGAAARGVRQGGPRSVASTRGHARGEQPDEALRRLASAAAQRRKMRDLGTSCVAFGGCAARPFSPAAASFSPAAARAAAQSRSSGRRRSSLGARIARARRPTFVVGQRQVKTAARGRSRASLLDGACRQTSAGNPSAPAPSRIPRGRALAATLDDGGRAAVERRVRSGGGERVDVGGDFSPTRESAEPRLLRGAAPARPSVPFPLRAGVDVDARTGGAARVTPRLPIFEALHREPGRRAASTAATRRRRMWGGPATVATRSTSTESRPRTSGSSTRACSCVDGRARSRTPPTS